LLKTQREREETMLCHKGLKRLEWHKTLIKKKEGKIMPKKKKKKKR
jgi:hypothetical protein